MAENILSKKNAKDELQKMFDYYEIDIDDMDDKDLKKAIKSGFSQLVKGTMKGRLHIKLDNGIKIIQTTRNKTEIIYREIDGNAKAEMDGFGATDFYGKSYALMGAISELGADAIKQLKGVDLSMAETLGMIFLSV